MTKQPVSEYESFIGLIQAATEDKAIRDSILGLAQLDAFNRESLLNTFTQSMALRGAPQALLASLSILKDDAIAAKVVDMLK